MVAASCAATAASGVAAAMGVELRLPALGLFRAKLPLETLLLAFVGLSFLFSGTGNRREEDDDDFSNGNGEGVAVSLKLPLETLFLKRLDFVGLSLLFSGIKREEDDDDLLSTGNGEGVAVSLGVVSFFVASDDSCDGDSIMLREYCVCECSVNKQATASLSTRRQSL